MQTDYLIRAVLGRTRKDFKCASAWIAFEQHNRLIRQGWTVRIFNHARAQLTANQLEAEAKAEIGNAVDGEKSN